MTLSRWIVSASLLAAPLLAQPGFTDPTAGFVYTAGSRSVRPLRGVPGATFMGAPVLNEADAAWIAPGGLWAFVKTAGGAGFVRGLADAAPAAFPADGIIDGVERVAWTPDASAAVLYSSSASRLQRVRMAAGRISADDPVDLTAMGKPAALAIDPSGKRIVFGIAGAGLYAIDEGQAPVLLASMALPAAAAFSDAGRLYAVDAETRKIMEFGADGSPADFAVVDLPEGAGFDPVGLAVSGTGNYLMLADKASGALRVFETASRTATDPVPLDFAPVHLERLSTGATFLLNRPGGKQWLLVLDAADAPRVYFVPAGVEDAQ
jgi:hypothetical protein